MLVLLCTVLSSFTLPQLLHIDPFIYLFIYLFLNYYFTVFLIAEIKKNRKQAKHKEEQEETSVIGDLIIQTTIATWILAAITFH